MLDTGETAVLPLLQGKCASCVVSFKPMVFRDIALSLHMRGLFIPHCHRSRFRTKLRISHHCISLLTLSLLLSMPATFLHGKFITIPPRKAGCPWEHHSILDTCIMSTSVMGKISFLGKCFHVYLNKRIHRWGIPGYSSPIV